MGASLSPSPISNFITHSLCCFPISSLFLMHFPRFPFRVPRLGNIQHYSCPRSVSLQTTDAFPVVASLPPKNFSEGEKRRPEMRLLFAGYRSVYCRSIVFLLVVWLFEIYHRFIMKILTHIPYNR